MYIYIYAYIHLNLISHPDAASLYVRSSTQVLTNRHTHKHRKLMSQSGAASLYVRSWEHVLSNEDGSATNYDMTVMQFNLLAEGLSSPPPNIKSPPFPYTKESAYGGFDRVPNPDGEAYVRVSTMNLIMSSGILHHVVCIYLVHCMCIFPYACIYKIQCIPTY
jgi:hypothetical protein